MSPRYFDNPFYGKRHTDEAKEKDRRAHVGKKHTGEQKRKISKSLKGRSVPWLKGKKLSEEHKKRIRRKHLGIERDIIKYEPKI